MVAGDTGKCHSSCRSSKMLVFNTFNKENGVFFVRFRTLVCVIERRLLRAVDRKRCQPAFTFARLTFENEQDFCRFIFVIY
jgi:hypothetical protein